jgi:photosystem II stability/assembly factor-like uncharacterized protein
MILIIILLLSTSCILAEDGWNWQNPRPQGNDLKDIFIIDRDHAVTVGEFGTVMRTSNGGADWQIQNNAGGVPNTLNGVFFINAQTGWAAGEKGTILRTGNGGVSWTRQNSHTEIDMYDIYFIDEQKGWCAGRWGKLLKTTDGGQNWQAVISGTQRALKTIVFTDQDNGWIAGHGGVILHTENGGNSWKYQALDKGAHFQSIHVVNANTAWVAGEDGFVYQTKDGGQNWQKKEHAFSGDILSIHFFDDSRGILCGYATEYNEGIKYQGAGTILTTDDGGATWQIQVADTISPLKNMRLLPSGSGWAVGDRGYIIAIEENGKQHAVQSKSVPGVFYSADFIDNNNGWVVGYQTIIHTSNGGDKWESQEAEGISELLGVHVIDENTAIAVGGELISSGNDFKIHSQILKTEDAGKTWRYIRNQTMEYVFDIEFVNANTAWVVGYPNLIAKTTDGGQTWQTQTTASDNLFWAVTFIDASTGWAVGNSGRIRKTTDGGATWISQRSGTSLYLYDVVFLTAQKGWIVGEGGTILKTEDGGENWTKINSPKMTTFNSIFFIDANHARIVGNRGVLLRTDDGGNTWYDLPSGTEEDLSCVYFADDQTGWIISYQGTILKTTTGGINNTEQQYIADDLLPTKLILQQNYPNPFNAETIISYAVGANGHSPQHVELSIYNILGQRVATLVSERQQAGQYRVKWDASGFTSGIYLCKLNAGQYQAVKRLVLLK